VIEKSNGIDNNLTSQKNQEINIKKTSQLKSKIASKINDKKQSKKEINDIKSQSKYLSVEEILKEERDALSANLLSKKLTKKQNISKKSSINNNNKKSDKDEKLTKKDSNQSLQSKTVLKSPENDFTQTSTDSASSNKKLNDVDVLSLKAYQATPVVNKTNKVNKVDKKEKTKNSEKQVTTNKTTDLEKDKNSIKLSNNQSKKLQNNNAKLNKQTDLINVLENISNKEVKSSKKVVNSLNKETKSSKKATKKQINFDSTKNTNTKSKKQQKQVDKKVAEAQRKLKRKIPEAFEYMSEQSKIDLAIGFADIMNDDVKLSDYSMLLVPPYRGLERFIYDLQVAKNIEVKMIGQAFEKDALGQYKLKTGYMRRIKSVIYNEVLVALYTEYFNKRNFYAHSDNTLASSSRFISDKMVVKQIYQDLIELINYNCKKLKEIGFLYEPKKL